MKELIEKIKELQVIARPYSVRMTCKQILEVIEDYESKPFDPVECGLKLWMNCYILDNNKKFYIEQKDKTKWFISISGSCYFYIEIPNHRFGVELLRNLGVIDAD